MRHAMRAIMHACMRVGASGRCITLFGPTLTPTHVTTTLPQVIRSFPRHLDPSSVKYDQVRKLVGKVLEAMAKQQAGEPATAGTPKLMPSLSPKLPPVTTPTGMAASTDRFSTSTLNGDRGSTLDDAISEPAGEEPVST
jgi:hypothetical protein